jgi:hypothetical protein
MKNFLQMAIMLLTFGFVNAQSELDLTNKTFQQVDKIPNSTTEILFTSKNQIIYIITNVINGNTYIDKCPGKATLSGNKVSINCNCEDKELYPDPITDSFIYDSKSKKLTSKSNRSTDGAYFVWNLK